MTQKPTSHEKKCHKNLLNSVIKLKVLNQKSKTRIIQDISIIL